jgi:hypothetical protein
VSLVNAPKSFPAVGFLLASPSLVIYNSLTLWHYLARALLPKRPHVHEHNTSECSRHAAIMTFADEHDTTQPSSQPPRYVPPPVPPASHGGNLAQLATYAPPPPTPIYAEAAGFEKQLSGEHSAGAAGDTPSSSDPNVASYYHAQANAELCHVHCKTGHLDVHFCENDMPTELNAYLDYVHWRQFVCAVNTRLHQTWKHVLSGLFAVLLVGGMVLCIGADFIPLLAVGGLALALLAGIGWCLLLFSVVLPRSCTPGLHRRRRRYRQRMVRELNHLLGPGSPVSVDLEFTKSRDCHLLDRCELVVRLNDGAAPLHSGVDLPMGEAEFSSSFSSSSSPSVVTSGGGEEGAFVGGGEKDPLLSGATMYS